MKYWKVSNLQSRDGKDKFAPVLTYSWDVWENSGL